MDVCSVRRNVRDSSVALVESKERSVWGVSRCMCDVAVDRVFSFTVILLCWNSLMK